MEGLETLEAFAAAAPGSTITIHRNGVDEHYTKCENGCWHFHGTHIVFTSASLSDYYDELARQGKEGMMELDFI